MKSLIRLFVVAAFLPLCSVAQSSTNRISLDGYLALLQTNHPLFAAEALNRDIAEAEREAALGDQNWLLESAPRYGFDEPVSSSTFNPEELSTLGVDVNLSRPLWSQGGRVGVGWAYQHLDQVTQDFEIPGQGTIPTAFPKYHQNQLSLNYSLPLLQNRGGTLDRLESDLLGFAVEAAALQSAEAKEQFLLQSAQRFVDWAQLQEQVRIAEGRQGRAQQLFDNNSSNRAANAVSQVDLLRSESDLSAARQASMLAKSQRDALGAELSLLAFAPELSRSRPSLDLFRLPDPAKQTVADTGLRSLRLFEVERQRLEREGKGLKSAQQWRLDLNLSGGLAGGGADIDDSTSLDQPNFGASLGIRRPLGDGRAKGQAKVNRLRMQKNGLDRERIRVQIDSGLANLDVQMKELRRVIELNEQQLAIAAKRTAEEQRQYERGRSPLTFVIQSREAEAAAQNLRAQNAGAYQKLFLERRALLDRLLP